MIRKLKEDRQITLYCDTHNHSRKKNIFLYGCTGKDPLKKEHVFPLLMKKFCPVYSYQDSVFAVQKEKETTARVFTLQLSHLTLPKDCPLERVQHSQLLHPRNVRLRCQQRKI